MSLSAPPRPPPPAVAPERGARPAKPEPTDPERRDWEDVAARWIAREPQRLWREYCDRMNETVLRPWLGERSGRRLLKTDLFDEAVGRRGLVGLLAESGGTVVGIDASQTIVRSAQTRQGRPALNAIGADVRQLPFRDAAFEAVVSNSTLDHFAALGDLAKALAELHRVLVPGGGLLLTLDNDANPVVWVRNRLPLALLRGLGLVPYRVGVTCGPKRLETLLRQTGFLVDALGTYMHVPRLPAVWLASLLDRFASPAAQERYLAGALAFDRLERLPTRARTGYFLVASARKV